MTSETIGATMALVVDDDVAIRELVAAQLRADCHVVQTAGSLREARVVLDQQQIDVIILDLNLPDGDGVDLCRELRGQGYRGAIVMVSARDGIVDRILGLEFGADDYLVKPFEARELTARIRSVLRRVSDRSAPGTRARRVMRFDGWRLDLLRRRLLAPDERVVMLTSAEFDVLRRLAEAPGQVLSREELQPDRPATAAFDRSIDMLVSRLRQKMGIEPDGEALILTVRHQGYMLGAEVVHE